MKIPLSELDNKIKQIVEKDENILFAFRGDVGGEVGQVYVALTNRRVLVLNKGIWGMGEKTSSIPYKKITSIDKERKIGCTTVIIKEGTIETSILNMKAETANQIFEKLNSIIENEKVQTENEPLKILKLRYAKGEISKKEYEQMKKELGK